jgi:hypothetical protein
VIKFAPPAALDRRGNNLDRLQKMHPTLRELSQGIVEALGRGNAPHSYLHERSKSYDDIINRALEEIDFALLYMEGLRLANAERAVSGDGELPPLEAPVRERMDSLLQLHGTFVLASRDGLEAYEAEQRYKRNQQQEADYRSAAVDFANSLQGRPEVVDPAVASAALSAAEEIGRGGNPERSGTVATGVLGNLTVTLSVAAAVGTLSLATVGTGSAALIAMAMAVGLVATEGLKKSQPFIALSGLVTQGIDHVGRVELKLALKKLGDRFKPQLDLFRSTEKPLSKLAGGREEFAWLGNVVGWIEEQTNTEPMAPAASSPPPTPSLPEPQPPTKVGNIYLAKVVSVEPSLECAFVEFGGARLGFLAFNEIHPDYYQVPLEQRSKLVDGLRNPAVDQLEIQFGEIEDYDDDQGVSVGSNRADRLRKSKRFKIQEVIKRRQVMLVKVTKDEAENKDAALTTFISIAGSYLVLMPNTAMQLRVSGSIPSPEDRLRLTQLDLDIPEGMGIFVRSSAQRIPDAEIVDEFADLIHTWESVRDMTLKSQAPTLVYDATNRLVTSG